MTVDGSRRIGSRWSTETSEPTWSVVTRAAHFPDVMECECNAGKGGDGKEAVIHGQVAGQVVAGGGVAEGEPPRGPCSVSLRRRATDRRGSRNSGAKTPSPARMAGWGTWQPANRWRSSLPDRGAHQRPACRMELAPERIRRRSPVRPAFPMDTAVDEASLHRPLRLLPGVAARRLHRRQRNDPHPHIRLKPSIRTALQSLRTPNCSESFRTRCSTIDPLVTCRCMTASLLSPRVSGHCGPPLRTTGRRTVE